MAKQHDDPRIQLLLDDDELDQEETEDAEIPERSERLDSPRNSPRSELAQRREEPAVEQPRSETPSRKILGANRLRRTDPVEETVSDEPRRVAVPRTKKGTARTFASHDSRDFRARLLFAGLLLLALVGLVSTCQNLTDSEPTGFAAASHAHVATPSLAETAIREAELYISRQWRDMLPFPSRGILLAAEESDTDSSRQPTAPPVPVPDVEAVFLQNSVFLDDINSPQERHDVLVVSSNGEEEQNFWQVTVWLTTIGEETGTISHALDPRVVPSQVGATPSSCEAVYPDLSALARDVVEDWAEAWLSSDVGALVRIAGATQENTVFPGYARPMGLISVASIYPSCSPDATADHLTVTLTAIDCATGSVVQVAQNIDLKFRTTPNPQIPAWAPVGETPIDRSSVLTEADRDREDRSFRDRGCETLEEYRTAPAPQPAVVQDLRPAPAEFSAEEGNAETQAVVVTTLP